TTLNPQGRGARVVKVGEEVRLVPIRFVGMRNSILTQSKVKSQAMSGAPVVLEIGIRRDGIPISMAFITTFGIGCRISQNEVQVIKSAVECTTGAATAWGRR